MAKWLPAARPTGTRTAILNQQKQPMYGYKLQTHLHWVKPALEAVVSSWAHPSDKVLNRQDREQMRIHNRTAVYHVKRIYSRRSYHESDPYQNHDSHTANWRYG